MKTIITGVAGFIGSNLAKQLVFKGHDVIGIDNLSQGIIENVPDGVDFYEADIRDKNILEIFNLREQINQVVFHLAAKNCISACQRNPQDTFDVNVLGSLNVHDRCDNAGMSQVIYVESAAVYEGTKNFPTPETEKLCPQSVYGFTKAFNFIEKDRRTPYAFWFSVRPFNVYGMNQDNRRSVPPVIISFIKNILAGKRSVIYGDGEQKRDFIHVDDVIDFLELAMCKFDFNSSAWNLGTGISTSINELYNMIARLMNSDIKPIYATAQDFDVRETRADISKAKKKGWTPKIELQEGLKIMINEIEELEQKNTSDT